METSCLWPMLHRECQVISQVSQCFCLGHRTYICNFRTFPGIPGQMISLLAERLTLLKCNTLFLLSVSVDILWFCPVLLEVFCNSLLGMLCTENILVIKLYKIPSYPSQTESFDLCIEYLFFLVLG